MENQKVYDQYAKVWREINLVADCEGHWINHGEGGFRQVDLHKSRRPGWWILLIRHFSDRNHADDRALLLATADAAKWAESEEKILRFRPRIAEEIRETGEDPLVNLIPRPEIQEVEKPKGAQDAEQQPDAETGRKTLIRMALAELLTTGANAAQIAKKIGVPRTTMLSWSEFRVQYDKVKHQEAQAKEAKLDRERNKRDQKGKR